MIRPNLKQRIYLDHAATTPIFPQAREAMAKAMEQWANPSSPHAEGRASRSLLEQARKTIAEVLDWRHDVIFTSGASEAVEIAAKRARIEAARPWSDRAPHCRARDGRRLHGHPGRCRRPDRRAALEAILAAGPTLVAIQHVNNETGVVQPLDRLGRKIREAGRCCSPIARKVPGSFRCLTPTSSPPARTSSVVPRAWACSWCATLRRSSRSAARKRAIGAEPRTRRRRRLRSGARGAAVRHVRLMTSLRTASSRRQGLGRIGYRGRQPSYSDHRCHLPSRRVECVTVVQFDLAGIAVSAGSACSSGK